MTSGGNLRAADLQANRGRQARLGRELVEAKADESALVEYQRTGYAPVGYKACRYCGKLNLTNAMWCANDRCNRSF